MRKITSENERCPEGELVLAVTERELYYLVGTQVERYRKSIRPPTWQRNYRLDAKRQGKRSRRGLKHGAVDSAKRYDAENLGGKYLAAMPSSLPGGDK